MATIATVKPAAAGTTPTIVDRFKQTEIVSRIVRSDMYRRLIGEERSRVADQRVVLIGELHSGTKAEEARKEAAARAYWKADAEAQAAADRAKDARNTRHEAWLAMESARSVAQKRRDRIAAQLEELADPRIEALRYHLELIHEAARHCTKPVVERVDRDLFGRQRAVFDWNDQSVEKVRDELRAMIDELQALKVADYGADPGPRLVEILARAEAICHPLGLYEGQRIKRHEIEA
jgi:hypothetical protein